MIITMRKHILITAALQPTNPGFSGNITAGAFFVRWQFGHISIKNQT
jgi:hypothetical protein